nr:hypothetical protein [Saprospiraceae bacterium]
MKALFLVLNLILLLVLSANGQQNPATTYSEANRALQEAKAAVKKGDYKLAKEKFDEAKVKFEEAQEAYKKGKYKSAESAERAKGRLGKIKDWESLSKEFEKADKAVEKAKKDCDKGDYDKGKKGIDDAIKDLEKIKEKEEKKEAKKEREAKRGKTIEGKDQEIMDAVDKKIAELKEKKKECEPPVEEDESNPSDSNEEETNEEQAANDEEFSYDSSIWDNIDLTSARMKPKAPGVPWWIYAGGGAVVTGVGIVLLTDDDDDPDVPLVANDLSITVDCGEGGTVNPLSNDEGVGLMLQSFDAPSGLVSQNGNILVIDPAVTDNFTIAYTVEDANGNTDQATVSVTVNIPPLDAPSVQLETEQGVTLQGNLLNLINCSDCELIDLGDHPNLNAVTFNSSGEFTAIPDPDFFGTLEINYSIRKPPCPPVASSVVIIEVHPDGDPPVANDVTITVTCGEGGSVNPILNDEGEGLILESFTSSTDWVSQEGDLIIISPSAFEDFEITYTVVNEDGLSAEATVFVVVERPPLNVQNLSFQGEVGGLVEFNVLQSIGCDDCELIDLGDHAGISEAVFTPDGEVSITLSPDFTGEITLTYTVRDACQSEATGNITIFVSDEPCEINGDLVVTPSDCGLDNGVLVFATEELFGSYNFLIDGEPASDTVENLAPGSYVFTVIDAENANCREEFTGLIDENPFDVSLETEITPGNCHTSGDIMIIVNEGPLITDFLSVSTDFGDFEYSIGESEFSLLQLMEGDLGEDFLLGPVQLTFTVEGAQDRCTQVFDFLIPEEEVPFDVEDATFTLMAGEEITLNFLDDYAIGEELSVVNFDDISGADFHVESNGLMSFFTSQPGEYVSSITVTDICGREITASIGFIVERIPCKEFEVNFIVTPSGCGISTGFVAADIIPFNDDLVLTWSNGQWGLFLENVPTGTYGLEIYDPETDCTENFEVFVDEEPEGQYLVSSEVAPGSCNTPPELVVELESVGSDFLNVQAESPEGDVFIADIPEGVQSWGDFFPLTPGLWTFTIIDEIAGADCAQSVIIQLPEPDLPELTLVEVIPPSDPSANDGSIIVNIVGGFPPYTLFVNDMEFPGLEPPGNFQIDNVSEGIYEMIVLDAFECFSEVLVVEVVAGFTSNPWALTSPNPLKFTFSGQTALVDEDFLSALTTDPNGIPELPGITSESVIVSHKRTGFSFSLSQADSRVSFTGLLQFSSGYIADYGSGFSYPFKANTLQPGIGFQPFPNFENLDLTVGYRQTSFHLLPGSNSNLKKELTEWPVGAKLDYPINDRLDFNAYGNLLFEEWGFDQLRVEYGLNFTWEIR